MQTNGQQKVSLVTWRSEMKCITPAFALFAQQTRVPPDALVRSEYHVVDLGEKYSASLITRYVAVFEGVHGPQAGDHKRT